LKRVNCDKKLALDVAMGRTTNVKGDDLLFSNVPTLIYNRLEDNFNLSNKKALFRNISSYYRSIGLDPF
jgi:tubulin--tyrosine ligase